MPGGAVKKSKVTHIANRSRFQHNQLLEAVIAEHQSSMRRFLRLRLPESADREDVLQELFLKLANMEDLDQRLPCSSNEVRGYLLTMATNLIRDRVRRAIVRQNARTELLERSTEIDDFSTEEKFITDRRLAAMQKVLARLKPDYRNAFVLSRFKSLNYQEIAEHMNLPVSTVEKYISRALHALRKEWGRV